MKKRNVLFFLLALILCLSLFACSSGSSRYSGKRTELSGGELEGLYGTWICNGPVLGDLSTAIYLSEGGVCDLGNGEEYTWNAVEYANYPDMAVIEFCQGKKVLYTMEVYSYQEGNYLRSDGSVRNAEEQFQDTYTLAQPVSDAEWFRAAYTTWHPAKDWNNDIPVEFRENGTCAIDGKEYKWCREPFSHWSGGEVYVMVYDQQGIYYYLLFTQAEGGYPRMQMEKGDMENRDFVGTYNFHSMMEWFGRWDAFDESNPVVDNFGFYEDAVIIENHRNTWVVGGDTTEDALRIYVPAKKDAQMVFTLTMEGEYPHLVIDDLTSGQSYSFYYYDAGYDDQSDEAIYYTALNALNCYIEDDRFYHPITDERYDDAEILVFAYEQLQKVADYKDAQAYLDRFTILRDKLVRVTYKNEDKLGNVGETKYWDQIGYDELGRVMWTNEDDYAERFGIGTSSLFSQFRGYVLWPAYDAAGNVIEIAIKDGNQKINAKCTPVYEDGRVARMHIQTASSESDALFTYDDMGRVVLLEMTDGTIRYTYDEQGVLTRKVMERSESRYTTFDYVCENGRLEQVIESWVNYNLAWTETAAYTYDENGEVAMISRTSDKEDYKYVREEYHYVYEDIYFYNAT